MKLNDKIEECNNLIDEARKKKDIARVSDDNINSFQEAAMHYSKAAEVIFNEILKNDEIDFNVKIKGEALGHYYKFEEYDCLYGYNYKTGNFAIAIELASKGQTEIEKSIQIIDENFHLLNPETKEFLAGMKKNWKSSSLSIKIKKLEPIAKKAMNDNRFIEAFDTFNKMLTLQRAVYEYNEKENLDQVYIRISKGNYVGMAANVNQAFSGVLLDKNFSFDLTNDLLTHFLKSFDLSINAFEANPEWDKYRLGAEVIKSNIQTLLKSNKNRWFDYLIHNNDNNYLKKIMQQTDNEHYKRQTAKLELEKDKLKRLIVTGGFWFGIFIGLGYFFWQVALSEISWFRFITLMFFLPLFFTMIGAFALRTNEGLKEENFMKLMELSLKINFKGLKVLTDKGGKSGEENK